LRSVSNSPSTAEKEASGVRHPIAKGGPKLTKRQSPGKLPGFGLPRGGVMVRNAAIAEVASTEANVVELKQPVVAQTGLGTTRYDFILKYTPDAQQQAQLCRPWPCRGPNAPPPPPMLMPRLTSSPPHSNNSA
jgi:hypothetical protein